MVEMNNAQFKHVDIEHVRIVASPGATIYKALLNSIAYACLVNVDVLLIHNSREILIEPSELVQEILDNNR